MPPFGPPPGAMPLLPGCAAPFLDLLQNCEGEREREKEEEDPTPAALRESVFHLQTTCRLDSRDACAFPGGLLARVQ